MPHRPTPQKLYKEKIKTGLLQPDPVQEKAVHALNHLHARVSARYEQAQTWQSRFKNLLGFKDDVIQGIYMYGDVGRGKSMLMDLFYSTLPQGIKKRRVHFHAFMIETHDYFHSRRNEAHFRGNVDSLVPSLAALIHARARVLCFDEFHVTDVADAMILGRLFTALYDLGVVVVSTSNWPPDRLYEGGLQRDRFTPFIELLKKHMQVIHLDSDTDYRSRFLREEGMYFYPLGADAKAHADKVFAKLTQGAPIHREFIKVKGRNVVIPRAADGAARFSFSEICENAYGAEDYIAIAERYHTVFLEDVPVLPKEKRNEAKRLMTLIDSLYEAETKLVVTAAVPAEDIYKGRDHGFEFQRTVSRLNEMQSV